MCYNQYRYEQNSKRSMAVEGSLPWQREPTAVSSKRAKFIIFAFCNNVCAFPGFS